MKKLFFVALSAMLFASCEKDFIDTPALESTGKMTIKASIENVETRTTIEYTTGTGVDYSAGEISKWVAGDQIRVFFYDAGGDEQGNVVFKAKAGGTNVEFEIDDTESNTLPANGTYTAKAVYPEDATSFLIDIYGQTQNGEDLSHLGLCDLMTAQAIVQVGEGNLAFDLSFTHRLPLLRFSLLNDTGGDITISEISIRSENSSNAFLDDCSYDINSNDIDRYYTSNASLAVDNSPTIAHGGTFDGYMISGSEVLDDTDNVIVSITFNDGVNNGVQEFIIPRASNAFLKTPFEDGKRYYFKLKLTGANIVQGNYGGLEYRFDIAGKRATILGFAAPATTLNIPVTASYNGVEYDVVAIRDGAFSGTGLTGVTFAAGSQLTTIGNVAFYDCTSLTGTLAIPASVTTIGDWAFTYTDLTEVTFAAGSQLTTIGGSAFASCTSLTGTLAIPASVTTIGEDAFSNTDLTGVTFAAGSQLTTIVNSAFSDCTSLTGTLAIPASVTTIGNNAFSGTDLTEVTFAAGSQLNTIGNSAFRRTALTIVNMYCTTPPTLGSNIFTMISGLTINVPQSAAGAYSTEINNKTKGWSHTGTLPVTLVAGGSVTLPNLGEADGDVTVSATL